MPVFAYMSSLFPGESEGTVNHHNGLSLSFLRRDTKVTTSLKKKAIISQWIANCWTSSKYNLKSSSPFWNVCKWQVYDEENCQKCSELKSP